MSFQRKTLSRLNAPYPRIEEVVINNTGRALTSADIGGVVLLDWLPSGSDSSAIAPSTATLIATNRKAIITSLLDGAGAVGSKIRVLLQGEDQALLVSGQSASAKTMLIVGAVASAGSTQLTPLVKQAIGAGSTSGVTPATVVAAQLTTNPDTTSGVTGAVFFDGSAFGTSLITD